MDSASHRILRRSNRISLSLSHKKRKGSLRSQLNDEQSSVEPTCSESFTDNTPTVEKQISLISEGPSNLPISETLQKQQQQQKNTTELESSITVRKDLQSPETVIVVSDDENDFQTPSKKSIREYFTPSKHRNVSPCSSRVWTTGVKHNKAGKSSTKKSSTIGSQTVPKKDTGKARRKICPSTNIKMLTKKYFDDSQKQITNFFKKDEDPNRIGYCRVLKESVMPAIITGDMDVESMLSVTVDEGTERLSFSQNQSQNLSGVGVEMSPSKIMERIERVQSDCYDPIREDWNMERVAVPIVVPDIVSNDENDNSVILRDQCQETESKIRLSSTSKQRRESANEFFKTPKHATSIRTGSTTKTSSAARSKSSRGVKGGKKIVCPPYKIIAGTNFAVDAFRYGDIEGVTHYFLTHFHADHYIGLKKTFTKPLIMSEITARLVKTFINVSEEYYHLIKLHDAIIIDNVQIIALDANHCPGGVMFLFRLPDGTNILHTGDFRASPEMEEYPEFWNFPIDCIYLDTTYLSSKYAFKSQWESVADARETVSAYLKKNIGMKVLIVCGSYLIGKEKVWQEIAMSTGMKVWTEPNRWKALKAIAEPQQLSLLVADPLEANIHVLAMNKLSYDELNEYLQQFPDRYDSVIAIRPSGWEKNSKPQYRGRINIIGVEYSEHSSFEELKRFVQYLRPREVISTVPYGNSNQNRTPTVPASWYQGEIRPQRKALQLSITNFITPAKGNATGVSTTPSGCLLSRTKEPLNENDGTLKIETVSDEVIALDTSDGENAIKKSENGEVCYDSDWLS